jgi:hypothetical protein
VPQIAFKPDWTKHAKAARLGATTPTIPAAAANPRQGDSGHRHPATDNVKKLKILV